jgi:AraC-like DNA-binding protein
MELGFLTEQQIDETDFRVHYHKVESGNTSLIMHKNHYHKTYEIYYLLSGEKYYFIKDKTFLVKPGDIVLVNSFDFHRTSSVKNHPSERLLVRIDDSFIARIVSSFPNIDLFSCFKKDVRVLRVSNNLSNNVQSYLYKMLSLYEKYISKVSSADEFYMRIMAVDLLIMLNELLDANQYQLIDHPSIMHKKISEIIKFINNNYMNDISLDSISNQFYISKFYFARLFKEIIGMTFIEYLNVIKLKEAENLLLKTNFSISRIADEVGFCDSSYFCKAFKKYYKYSPSDYRKEQLK